MSREAERNRQMIFSPAATRSMNRTHKSHCGSFFFFFALQSAEVALKYVIASKDLLRFNLQTPDCFLTALHSALYSARECLQNIRLGLSGETNLVATEVH